LEAVFAMGISGGKIGVFELEVWGGIDVSGLTT